MTVEKGVDVAIEMKLGQWAYGFGEKRERFNRSQSSPPQTTSFTVCDAFPLTSNTILLRIWLVERARQRTNYPRPQGIDIHKSSNTELE